MILVVSDKFKGTLDSRAAGQAIAAGLAPLAAARGLEICVEAMADGGEGTGEALGGSPVPAHPGMWVLPAGDMLVESAACVGRGSAELMARPLTQRSSRAFGEALAEALAMSAPEARVYAAIGGTATADGGAGMLQALGYTFYNKDGEEIHGDITPAVAAEELGAVRPPSAGRLGELRRLCGLSDVRAALCADGCLSALDFVEQKGAVSSEMPILRRSFGRLSALLAPGRSGAFDGSGGGLGFALSTVLGAEVLSGATHVLSCILCRTGRRPTLLATGEGSVDGQTAAGGKVVGAVNDYGRRHGIGVLTVGGRVAVDAGAVYGCVVAAGAGDVPSGADEAARRVRAAVGANLRRIEALLR